MSATSFPPGYLEAYCGAKLMHTGIAFIPLEIFFVLVRYYARYLSETPWRLDDALILPSLIFNLALISISLVMVTHAGVGHHIAAVEMSDPAKVILWAKLLISIPIVYVLAVTLPKLAILSLYFKIFTQKTHRLICYTIAGILLASAFANIIAGALECVPIAKFWDKSLKGHCINANAYFRWASLPNIITDIAMLAIPLPVIWRLQTSRNVKIGLTITFITGSIGIVMAIVRFVAFVTVDATADGTWSSGHLLLWTFLEPGFYLIAACLPTFRPLAVYFVNKTVSSTGFSRSSRARKYGSLSVDNEHNDLKTAPGSQFGLSTLNPNVKVDDGYVWSEPLTVNVERSNVQGL